MQEENNNDSMSKQWRPLNEARYFHKLNHSTSPSPMRSVKTQPVKGDKDEAATGAELTTVLDLEQVWNKIKLQSTTHHEQKEKEKTKLNMSLAQNQLLEELSSSSIDSPPRKNRSLRVPEKKNTQATSSTTAVPSRHSFLETWRRPKDVIGLKIYHRILSLLDAVLVKLIIPRSNKVFKKMRFRH